MSEGNWSVRGGLFLENVMDAIQYADELGGLEGVEYVRAMNYLSDVCRQRANRCLNRMLQELVEEV